MRLDVHEIEDIRVAMIVGDDELAAEPGTLRGLAFFRAKAEEAGGEAKAYLGNSEPGN